MLRLQQAMLRMMMVSQLQQQGAMPPGGFPMQQPRPLQQQQQPDLARQQQQQLASFLAHQYAMSMSGQGPVGQHGWGFGGGAPVKPRCQNMPHCMLLLLSQAPLVSVPYS